MCKEYHRAARMHFIFCCFCFIAYGVGASWTKYRSGERSELPVYEQDKVFRYCKNDDSLRHRGLIMAHDAGTTYIYKNNTLFNWVITQPYGGFQKLLDCGARALDIRPALSRHGEVIMHHGSIPVSATLKDALRDVKDWLRENSNETVLLYFSHFKDNSELATRGLLSTESVYIIPSCEKAASITQDEIKAKGSVVAIFNCVNENYDPNIHCEVSKTDLCFKGGRTSLPMQRFLKYFENTLGQSERPSTLLTMLQAHWQYGVESILIGTLHHSSIIRDSYSSGINHLLAQLIANYSGCGLNIVEMDNVCDNGNKVRALLNSRPTLQLV